MKVLIACQADGTNQPRLTRFSRLFRKAGYQVFNASRAQARPDAFHLSVRNRNGPIARRLARYSYFAALLPDFFGWKDRLNIYRHDLQDLAETLKKHDFDMVMVQDWAMLPVVLKYGKNASIIVDLREIYLEQEAQSAIFRKYERPERDRIFREYLACADLIIATSEGHADHYRERYGVTVNVIRSASAYQPLHPQPVDPSRIKLVHHGVMNKNRGLEYFIELMDILDDRYMLNLYLVGPQERKAVFETAAKKNPRIQVHEPAPLAELVTTLNQYDIGIHYLLPLNDNLNYALPNKLFEFIQARLAVIIGPSPNMAQIVRDYDCGIVVPEFSLDQLATHLNALRSENVLAMKHKSHAAARELCEEVEGERLLALIAGLRGEDD